MTNGIVNVVTTDKFLIKAGSLGWTAEVVKALVEYLRDHYREGEVYHSLAGQTLSYLPWEGFNVLYVQIDTEWELYLVDLFRDSDPPPPPNKPSVLTKLGKSLLRYEAVHGLNKVLDHLMKTWFNKMGNAHFPHEGFGGSRELSRARSPIGECDVASAIDDVRAALARIGNATALCGQIEVHREVLSAIEDGNDRYLCPRSSASRAWLQSGFSSGEIAALTANKHAQRMTRNETLALKIQRTADVPEQGESRTNLRNTDKYARRVQKQKALDRIRKPRLSGRQWCDGLLTIRGVSRAREARALDAKIDRRVGARLCNGALSSRKIAVPRVRVGNCARPVTREGVEREYGNGVYFQSVGNAASCFHHSLHWSHNDPGERVIADTSCGETIGYASVSSFDFGRQPSAFRMTLAGRTPAWRKLGRDAL